MLGRGYAPMLSPMTSDYLKIAVVALIAVALAKRFLPMVPGVGAQAAAML